MSLRTSDNMMKMSTSNSKVCFTNVPNKAVQECIPSWFCNADKAAWLLGDQIKSTCLT